MGNIRNLKAMGWKRKTRILAAVIISTVYAVIGISLTAQAAQTLPVKCIGTDIVPAKYRNFILDMSDYPLSNATMESGAWKYVKSGNTVTAPNNTNLGAGTGQSTALDMLPCKANASLFAPSVGTWIDENGKKRNIDLTMYATSYNGGGISSWYGKKNVLSFMAGPEMKSAASGVACSTDENGNYSITLKCVFTFHDTHERVPSDFCGITGFNDLDGYAPYADPAEGIECISGFNAQYMKKDAKLASYGINGWGGTLNDGGDESDLECPEQVKHRYSATWEGPEFTIRYTSGRHPYVHSNFATPILYDADSYKINMKVIDGNGQTLQENQVVAQAKLGDSWDVSGSLPSINGYAYSRLADGSDPLSGTIGASNQRDQNIVLVYTENKYTVKFIDGYDGTVLKTEQVEKGHDATPPSQLPIHKGYIQKVWDTNYENVTSDITVTMPYRPIVYTIKYDPNGATSGTMPDKEMGYGKTGNLDSNQFERRGYSFASWKNGNKTYADGAEITNLSDTDNDTVTMSAQWTPISYHIVFDKNRTDAIGTTEAMDMEYDTTKTLTPNGYTSASSKFATWNTKPDGSGETYSNKQEVKNLVETDGGTVTLYAQWSTNTYTVTFVDGLTGKTISTPNVSYGAAAIPPTKPVHEGYTATTWDGNYQNVTHDETVTLQYRPNVYEIAFKPNGGTGNMNNQQMEYDKAKALARNAFTRTGYTFTGWKEQDASTKHADEETVKNLTNIDGDTITLLAQWEPNAYIIKYNANGGTGSMADQHMKYDIPAKLTANAYRKTGYTFTGWRRDDKETGIKYRNRETVTNLLSANGATTTMYAQWKANEYTVTFIDGHDGKTIGTETVTHGANATEPNKPTHDGYTATSWDKPLSNITGDTVITLAYRQNAYIIRFDKNAADATGSTADRRMEYDKVGNLTRNGYSRAGYTWLGWSSSADGNGTMYSDEQNVINLTSEDGGTVTLYAVWKINRYTVTFIDGKTGDVIGRQEIDYGGNVTMPAAPSHSGYKPNGWNSNGINITRDTTITLSYQPISYQIAFEKNSGEANGTMPNQRMQYDQWANLNRNVFSLPGYRFAGWDTHRGTGTSYEDGERVRNLSETDGDIITLYARWIEDDHVSITYKVESDDGKGENAIDNAYDDMNPTTGTPKGSTATASKEYDFIGWYDFNGKLVSPDAEFIPSKPAADKWVAASYTAKFARKVFTVSFVGKDGGELNTEKVPYGNPATAPDAPAIDGYEFAGWDTSFDSVTSDLTVTAVYRELPKPAPQPEQPAPTQPAPQPEQKDETVDDLIQTGIDIAPAIAIPTVIASLIALSIARRKRK